jgi:DNA mismatch repair protein PMS2
VYKKSLRGFVAPGTQLDKSDDDAEGTDTREEDDDPDSSMPDAPLARSPSPTKRDVSKELIGPSSDETELGEYSSMPLAIPRSPAPEEERNEESEPQEVDYNSSEDEYIDEAEKKAREDAKVARMIAEAEEAAARPTESNIKRARRLLKLSQKKYQTLNLAREVEISVNAISSQLRNLQEALQASTDTTLGANAPRTSQLPTTLDAEERLTLTVSKSDFAAMRIIGQFNQGFILAVRPPSSTSPTPDLFIIDQHASDEKYNFERFSATTIMTSQKLVHPHPLHLTAIEEETILNNEHALTANGFAVAVDTSGSSQVGQRAKLVSLPMSNSATFTPADFEELLTLLEEHSTSTSSSSAMVTQQQYIPRPSKVRKLLASRACRSSIMIGKTLNYKQMDRVVRHMGEMDKPWSCPHGRPTMRHLFGLEKWESWGEGDGVGGLATSEGKTDWGAYLESRRG